MTDHDRAAFEKFLKDFGSKHNDVELLERLYEIHTWNDFAHSLLDQHIRKKSFSTRQEDAAWAMIAKIDARAAEKALEAAEAPEVDEAPRRTYPTLARTFLSAAEGLKWPKLRLRTEDDLPVVLGRAGANSRNPGHINVTDGGGYGVGRFYGRITPEGGNDLRKDVPESVLKVLAAYDADPAAEAKVQGQRTGQCMCCGRELTNAISIELGIGPICRDKWGI